MIDKAARVEDQVKKLPTGPKFLARREIKELPNILWDDEDVVDVVGGTYSGGNGLLVATNRRLIFVDKGMLGGLKVEDFALDKISSIQYETGMLLGKITIFTSGNKALISNVEKGMARTFAEGVRVRIAAKELAAPPVAVPVAAPAPTDSLGELERLGALREKGLLTDEEFSAMKRKILGL